MCSRHAPRVAVLGGGISGLAAAWNLARSRVPVQVVLYEGSSRLGGWLKSGVTSGGGVLELGPRSIRTNETAAMTTLDMISDVGLQYSVLSSSKAASRRLVYTDKHGLLDIPSNWSWLFRTKKPFTKPLIWSLMRDLFLARKSSNDEVVHEFAVRRFGKEIAEYLVDPLCRGVYAASSRSLSLKSCFSLLHQAEQTHGSVIRGMRKSKPPKVDLSACSKLVTRAKTEKWNLYTLKGGLGTLPEEVHKYLLSHSVSVRLNQPCRKIHFQDKTATIEGDDETSEYDHILSTLPSFALSALMCDGQHSSFTDVLDSIFSVTVGVVCLEYDGADVLPDKYKAAFGYLVPSTQSSQILGVVFDSSTFPEQDREDQASTRITVMLGGEWFGELFGNPDEVSEDLITEVALKELRNQLGIVKQPSTVLSRIHKNCIPIYGVGHSTKLDFISGYLSDHELPLSVTGSFYGGVSVNQCVHNAVLATNKLLEKLE